MIDTLLQVWLQTYIATRHETQSLHDVALATQTTRYVAQVEAPLSQFQPAPSFAFGKNFNNYGVTMKYQVLGVYPSTNVLNRLKQCESTVFNAYLALPNSQRGHLSQITLRWTRDTNRGLGGGSAISLKCNDLSTTELTSVFVHEMGHVTDTGLYEGHSSAGVSNFRDSQVSVFKDDPSVDFYSISWKNSNTRLKNSNALDFVTTYAQTDPFEDFAESYNFYLLHGSQFKYAAQFSSRLMRKYAYLRDRIFHGKEFRNNEIKLNAKKKSYDSTVLPFSLDNFLKLV